MDAPVRAEGNFKGYQAGVKEIFCSPVRTHALPVQFVYCALCAALAVAARTLAIDTT
jgi:hypothetical protein